MKHTRLTIACLLAIVSWQATAQNITHKVDSLLNLMTVDEMIGQLNLQPYYTKSDSTLRVSMAKGGLGALLKSNGAAHNAELQHYAVEHSRLGIPLMFHEDVIHGYRTIYPIPLAEACSWDLAQVEASSRLIAKEAAAAGIQLTYAPMVDVSRDGRWGRIMETSGEDPFLDAEMAAARVRGFQGSDLADKGTVMACVKHFAGYAAMKDGKDYVNEEFTVRDLEELYLPAYRACVAESVGSFMCSYTMYDGIPVTHSSYMNTQVLRKELGYDGLLMTDWSTFSHAYAEGAVDSKEKSAELGINCGIDMDMTSGYYAAYLRRLYDEGKVSLDRIREAAGRALAMKFKMGLFDDPYRYFNTAREASETLSPENRAQARAAAAGCMVLLKNDAVLPLKKGTELNVCGPMAEATGDLLGAWACKGQVEETMSIRKALGADFRVKSAANVAVVCIGEPASVIGEANTSAKLELEASQIQLLRDLKAYGKTVIAVLVSGRPLCLTDVVDNCDALLEAWYPGTEGAHAVADILTGRVNPSGKLVQTFPRHAGQIPMSYCPRRTFQTLHRSDMKDDSPLFPFGYGLSYTSYSYSAPRVSAESFEAASEGVPAGLHGDKVRVTVSVDVTNTGKVAGDEVVQLYVADVAASIIPRTKQLKAFCKVHLEAGETKTVSMDLDDAAFSVYAADHTWKVEPGKFRIMVGPSSDKLQEVAVEAVAVK